MNTMQNDIQSVLLSESQLKEIVERLGEQISKDYEGKRLLLVSVLKGSVVFMGDLMRAIKIPCFIDFMSVAFEDAVKCVGVICPGYGFAVDIGSNVNSDSAL